MLGPVLLQLVAPGARVLAAVARERLGLEVQALVTHEVRALDEGARAVAAHVRAHAEVGARVAGELGALGRGVGAAGELTLEHVACHRTPSLTL